MISAVLCLNEKTLMQAVEYFVCVCVLVYMGACLSLYVRVYVCVCVESDICLRPHGPGLSASEKQTLQL